MRPAGLLSLTDFLLEAVLVQLPGADRWVLLLLGWCKGGWLDAAGVARAGVAVSLRVQA